MAGGNVSITIPDLAKWQKKLGGTPSISTRGVKKAMRTAAKESTAIFKRGAPRLTGKLGGSARPRATAMAAKVMFDPIASQGRGKGKSFRSGYALDKSTRFPSTLGYRERIKAQVAAGPAKRAAVEIGKEVERLWRA